MSRSHPIPATRAPCAVPAPETNWLRTNPGEGYVLAGPTDPFYDASIYSFDHLSNCLTFCD
jgi:hypothetical protein